MFRSVQTLHRTSERRSAQVGGGGGEIELGKAPAEASVGFAEKVAEVGGATMSAVFRIDGTSDIECDGGAHKVS